MNADPAMRHPIWELLARYRSIFKAAWQHRHELSGPDRLADEAAFLPAALSLQETPVHPAPRRLALALIALFLIALTWSIVGQVDIVAVAPGRIVVSERTKVIQPLQVSVVQRVLVKDGDRVEAGQPLVELDPTSANADKTSVDEELKSAQSEVLRTRTLMQALAAPTQNVDLAAKLIPAVWSPEDTHAARAQLAAEWSDITAKLAKFSAEIARRQAEIATVREMVAKLDATVPIARQREADFKQLADQGFMSSHANQDRTRERIELERDLATQRARLVEANAALRESENTRASYLAETRHALREREATADLKRAQGTQEQAKANQRAKLTTLTAPVKGTVQQLATHTEGGVVTEAQPLMVTYRYTSGQGSDNIVDVAGNDTLQLMNLNAGQVTLTKTALGNLELLINATGERITVDKGLDVNAPSQQLEKVLFADGTVWTQAAMQAATANVTPNQTLIGTAGTDNLAGNLGNDILDGKGGADRLSGGAGNDTYRYRSGDGNDRITETDNGGGFDTLELLDLNAANVRIVEGTGYETDRIIDRATGQTITLDLALTPTSWTNMGLFVDQVKFADGTVWGTAQLKAAANANETLTGTAGADTLEGFGGNDVLDGGAGNDTLKGGTGGDSYLFVRGAGSDRVVENDQTAGSVDVLLMGSAITADQLWLRQSGNDLEVSIIGTSDKMTVADWYLGSQYHVEQFKTSNGETLLDSQVQNLVQAMAGFAPPAAGQTTLPANYQSSLGTVIAANWQ
ncbi:calcium-binding protein [Variovorax sp. N23]|uniref:calcium-binding protein n=1 Tax=Variovorax sp. N23 TaxID=2980555 RepID=UPI0021C9E6F2|nr:calcium-binding protein [Variovorax sp. N23]MCU4120153.1 biotin/lipoyl-binding protein [Variovorax sp. N23]